MVEPLPVPQPKMCQCIRQNTTKSTTGSSFNVSMLVDITILLHFTNIHPIPRLKALISSSTIEKYLNYKYSETLRLEITGLHVRINLIERLQP